MWIAYEQSFGAHELPRSAKPALRPVMFYERSLKRIELLSMRKALDRLDLSPVGPNRQIAA